MNFIIEAIAKQLGIQKIPETPKDFFDLFSQNQSFQQDLQKLEKIGIIRKGEDGIPNIIDQSKVNDIVKNYISQMLNR